MIIDTHVHTSCSDGRTTVAETVSIAFDRGVEVLAITDHDTLAAYPEACREARRRGIIPLSGVELSTRDEDGHADVHIVGLKIDLDNGALRHELDKLAKSRISARKILLDNANEYMAGKYDAWVPARFEDVLRRVHGTIVKPHIAMEISECSQKLGLDIPETEINRILRLPGIDVKKEGELTMEECISLIKEAGGVPLLAHPCEYGGQMEPVMKKFHELGGEATEICKYRYRAGPDDWLILERQLNAKTIALAFKYGLKITASSDFHGKPVEPGMEINDYEIDIGWLLE